MADNFQSKKDRNQKRIRDKHRNKKPNGHNTKPTGSKSIPKKATPNNWDRYEEIENQDDTPVDRTNYATLSENKSEKNYFQFKFEKKWLEEVEQSSNQNIDIFHVNLNLLKLAIGSIPLHERCNLPTKFLTNDEIKKFNQDAKEFHDKYEIMIKENGEKQQNTNAAINKNKTEILNKNKSKNVKSIQEYEIEFSSDEDDNPMTKSKSKLNDTKKCNVKIKSIQRNNDEVIEEMSSNIKPKVEVNQINSQNKIETKAGSVVHSKKTSAVNSDSSDDELDFLLNMTNDVKSTPIEIDNNTGILREHVKIAQNTTGNSNESNQPIGGTDAIVKTAVPTTDDLDMDILDSLLS